MKKVTLFVALIITAMSMQAQVQPHAIGLRLLANNVASGAEISYQHGRGPANRLEFDLGWNGNKNYSSTYLAGIYHWDWNLNGGLNWYVGPGAALGFYSDDAVNKFYFGIGGQIGLEYDFNLHNAPFLVSFDLRPMWSFVGSASDFYWPLALGLRYTW